MDIGEQARSVSYLYCRLPALDVTESVSGLHLEPLGLFYSLRGARVKVMLQSVQSPRNQHKIVVCLLTHCFCISDTELQENRWLSMD